MHKGRIPVTPAFSEGGELTGDYVISTDQFVQETDTVYHIESDLLRLQGHPYKAHIPKVDCVNPSRFTVFKLIVPDYNKFHLPEQPGKISLDSTVYVWKLVAVRVDSQGVLTPATTGQADSAFVATDNGPPSAAPSQQNGDEDGEDLESGTYVPNYWGMEHKQRQLIAAGCAPLDGVYETADYKTFTENGGTTTVTCELKRAVRSIEDGDLCEFGYGNRGLVTDADHRDAPTDMTNNDQPTLMPDFLGMTNDDIGDKCFFHVERDCVGVRHTGFVRGQLSGDTDTTAASDPSCNDVDSWRSCTAGMVSSQLDIMNKNYWLNQSRGPNNGIIWGNQLYVTIVDNLRGFVHRNTRKKSGADDGDDYDPTKYQYFLRHIKEYKISAMVRLCKVKLEAKLVNYLMRINSQWLTNFGFSFHHEVSSLGTTFKTPHMQVNEEPEEEPPTPLRTIDVDCAGKLRFPQHAHSHLAREYKLLGAPIGPKPVPQGGAKKGRGSKAASKK